MIYKAHDGARVRTRRLEGGAFEFERYHFTPERETLSVTYLSGEEAGEYIRTLAIQDSIVFVENFGAKPETVRRPPRLSVRAAVIAASALTVAVLSVILAPDAEAPKYPLLTDLVTTAPVVTPGERTSMTDRGGKRETLAPAPLPSRR